MADILELMDKFTKLLRSHWDRPTRNVADAMSSNTAMTRTMLYSDLQDEILDQLELMITEVYPTATKLNTNRYIEREEFSGTVSVEVHSLPFKVEMRWHPLGDVMYAHEIRTSFYFPSANSRGYPTPMGTAIVGFSVPGKDYNDHYPRLSVDTIKQSRQGCLANMKKLAEELKENHKRQLSMANNTKKYGAWNTAGDDQSPEQRMLIRYNEDLGKAKGVYHNYKLLIGFMKSEGMA